ncbi:hypothetical protein C8R46DRAFT_1029875 [Mycena filopes]|nr:hypothetical protein C8R46DRAFT_1029875 [Mycena filopes]
MHSRFSDDNQELLISSSDVLALAWPESHGFGPALPGFGLENSEARPKAKAKPTPGFGLKARKPGLLAGKRAHWHVDASALTSSIAHLNTSTFSPLQPLQDADVAGYLRHAHEQNLISTIEEGRKETRRQFTRTLEERSCRNWEAKKKRVFDDLGGRVGGDNRAMAELKKSFHCKSSLASSVASSLTLQMQSKMMTYDRVITELNCAAPHTPSSTHQSIRVSLDVAPDEEQYWDVLERTVQSRPNEAQLGGDPSVANKGRAFLFVKYYKNGEWEERVERLVGGQPLWARLFFLVRTGHYHEALDEALQFHAGGRRRGSTEPHGGPACERQFDGPPNQQGSRCGVWAEVSLMCGQFERAVAALWEVAALVLKECNAVGKKNGIKAMETLSAVVLTPDEWTPETGLVTAAQKIHRSAIAKKFDSEIKEAYKNQ